MMKPSENLNEQHDVTSWSTEWDSILAAADKEVEIVNELSLARLRTQAKVMGREEWNVDKVMSFYYPSGVNPKLRRVHIAGLENGYLRSSAKSIEEYVKWIEEIKAQGDSEIVAEDYQLHAHPARHRAPQGDLSDLDVENIRTSLNASRAANSVVLTEMAAP